MSRMISQKAIDDKNNEFFLILASINLSLDKEQLEKNISKLKKACSLLSLKSDLRKKLKITCKSLDSIFSALERIDKETLQSDLDMCSENLLKIFEDFKNMTGIFHVEKKRKRKHLCIHSLEQLSEISELKRNDLEASSRPNFLETMYKKIQKELESNDRIVSFISPILVVGYVENYQRLPRFGITTENSNYGILWKNCLLAATRDENLTNRDIELYISDKCKENYTCLFPFRKVKNFPGYRFFWILPSKLLLEIGHNMITSWTLPLVNIPVKSIRKEREEELKSLRLESKGKKHG